MSGKLDLRVSVTQLANFSCREGDLMPLGIAGPTARQGIRAHKKVQKKALDSLTDTASDKSENISGEPLASQAPLDVEVNLECLTLVDDASVVLRGRVDIIDFRISRLSEIKTTLVPVEHVPTSQHAIQWAQLYLYGYIFMHSSSTGIEREDTVELELLHVNIRADTTTAERRVVSKNDAASFAKKALISFVAWQRRIHTSRTEMQSSADGLNFPYGNFRTGQRDMAAAVFRAIRDGEALLCEAATGIGKTISTLFPAVKAMGEGEVKQITYLTAKVAGRLVALDALTQMRSAGLRVNAIQLRAKKPTCFCTNGGCERDESGRCPMTLGFFDRLPEARDEIFSLGIVDAEQFDEIAWNHQLCPFELALQMLPWMHVVIADYNYVFDPLVRLPHYSESRLDTVLLIDEAHNLLNRSREMFSGQVSRLNCLEEANSCRASHPVVSRSLEKLSNAMLRHANDHSSEEVVLEECDGNIVRSAAVAVEALMSSMAEIPPLSESSLEMFRTLCRFVVISDLFSERHRAITEVSQQGRRKEVLMSLYCLDASKELATQFKQYKSEVVFSATLRPSLFYRDTLGLPLSTTQLQLPSPFDSSRTNYAIVDWIDTRYRKRTDSLRNLVELIFHVGEEQHGNYLVFFPSYAYLNQVYSAFTASYPTVSTWHQCSEQSKEEQSEMLNQLRKPGHRIGFAILGGVFGEGIDYQGGSLIGVVVVSTGLPGLSAKTQLVADHHRNQGHDGYNFAYRYPGFSRVLQTVGRLIRSEGDSGVVVLVDDRFKEPFYRGLYPDTWNVKFPENLEALRSGIEGFWSRLPDRIGQKLDS